MCYFCSCGLSSGDAISPTLHASAYLESLEDSLTAISTEMPDEVVPNVLEFCSELVSPDWWLSNRREEVHIRRVIRLFD